MEKQKHDKVTEWLEDLQRESWQLELIVSAFSIFLLLQLINVLPGVFPDFNRHTDFSPYIHSILLIFLAAGMYASLALVVNLILHIFLRGFWIAAIGLRSVQQETDFEKLNYSPYFTNKLKRLVPSLDKLIMRLDNLASVVFAFAFLLVFMFLSFALWVLVINTLGFGIERLIGYVDSTLFHKVFQTLYSLLAIIIFISSIVYLLDTLSLGFFKKYQKISKIYYPIYRLIGWITLAGIYRSIYYSLVNRFPNNAVRLFLFGFLFLIVLFPFQRITFYKYFPDHVSDAKWMQYRSYDNLRKEEASIGGASITSDIISGEYLPLFIRYSVLLDCLSQLYNVYVNDSLYTDLDFYFYTHPNDGEKGLRTMIYTGNLPIGKNVIHIKRQSLNKEKKLDEKSYTEIPFWLESRE